MQNKKKEHTEVKSKLHPKNKHKNRYDFKALITSCPELEQYVKINKFNDESIDFFNPEAVKTLNKALLKHFYKIEKWNIPKDYLCPPIPGRADYIHHMAELLATTKDGPIPTGNQIKCLDIGVGANCIYPIIGNREYNWTFIGTDIDPIAIQAAKHTVESNEALNGKIELRLQKNKKNILYGAILEDEIVDLTVCNPPFHASAEEALSGTLRKLSSLRKEKVKDVTLNFGGQSNELWTKGGERKFVRDMIRQSTQFSKSCFWFSTIVSKTTNLNSAYEALKKANAKEVKTIEMGQGTKTSRIVAWTFLDKRQQKQWIKTRWE
ncbi:MAG: 23S rRNA (adenine(1618)-N(6))-methyltransferase RlmF [Flavobacteriales bacterium]|nr:23S rRNA (adenine(1618)-N(6))-methyltransferase RlmF [Flavobacteriales bacterium]